jgi:SpoVK/Ycf46/Vps4 family AAA+-type ATPase
MLLSGRQDGFVAARGVVPESGDGQRCEVRVAVAGERVAGLAGERAHGVVGSLVQALARLDERLRRAVDAAAAAYGPDAAADPHRGLYVGADELARLLSRAPALPPLGPAAAEPLVPAHDPSFGWLARAFALEPFDLDVVLIALAPELDLRYERLYAYLQDDVTRRRPSVDLALNLLCADAAGKLAARARFAPDAPLARHLIVELVSDPDRPGQPLLARSLALDDQVVRAILGERSLDGRLAGCARLVAEPRDAVADVPELASRIPSLARLARSALAEGRPLRLSFEGRPGSGRSRLAEGLAAELGLSLLAVDLARALEPAAESAARLALAVREARLQGALLFLGDLDALRGPDRSAQLEALLHEIEDLPGIAILAGSRPFAATRTAGRRRPAGLMSVEFPLPDARARRAHWRAALADAGVKPSARTIDALAGRFRLTSGQIADAVAAAGDRAAQRAAEAGPGSAAPAEEDLFAAARAQTGEGLAALARKVTPRRTFADIVLPPDRLAHLQEVCGAVRHRSLVYDDWGFDERLSLGKGLNVLFAGPSGTGKTLAAEILAHELGLELYAIDLSAVVSKYIGETEKNLSRIFDEAETASAILFFDEADALFGKRSEVKDAHDRYANIEVGYLLQRMEQYDGTVVLATNLRRNMDEAFVRRMHFTIEFPLPDEHDRLRIWRTVWPAATPRDPEVDLAALAERFQLAGGHIRNIALAGAFLAAGDGRVVKMEHLLHATRREYQKLGQLLLGGATEGSAGLSP